jgi:muramoyltetrapeptide carboxypeptidase LdcA involved in peptidoglycan recycling
VIAAIGGEDEIKVLRHLDPALLASHPKPFFGYSDNTNLHLFLWNLGLVSYHGGAVMVEFGRPAAMHPLTRRSLERALFTHAATNWSRPPPTATSTATGLMRRRSPRSRLWRPRPPGHGTGRRPR